MSGRSKRTVEQSAAGLPDSLQLERRGEVAVLRLSRPAKRNALDDVTVRGLATFFDAPPPGVRVVVLDAAGDHFSAGLDLNELVDRSLLDSVQHSRGWHRTFAAIESGGLPVIAVLKGAVIGGGLELACCAHLRVAEPSTFYALPEGQHGIFVGGGGSVRVPRLIGTHRMVDMMLTGRVLDAQEGQRLGLSHYLAPAGGGLAQALELAGTVARVAPVTTFAVLQVLPRIAAADPDQGYLMESLMAAVASTGEDAQDRMTAFLSGRRDPVIRREQP